jgi:CheY-like chemotaxis protein
MQVGDSKVLPGPGAVSQPTVLFVEDDVLVRLSTAELLRDEGYLVLEAVDAGEALTLLATGHPIDLVITDIRMPGPMNGLDLCTAVKDSRANLPVVLFSSHLPDGVSHCADAFLQKPYRPDELFDLVNTIVGVEWQAQTNPTAS